MPTLKRLCTAPGCGYTATQGSSYCKAHKAHSVARAAMRKRAADKRRPPASQRGYDRKWRMTRANYLRKHPRCERCGAKGEEVHHKRAIADGGTHAFDNLETLCGTCHKQHEADAQRGEGGRFKARWS